MKSVIITGAILMTGAIVYGFVDYSSISHDKNFRGMYDDATKENSTFRTVLPEQGKTAVVNGMESNWKEEIPVIIEEQPVKSNIQKTGKKTKQVSLKKFSRAELIPPMIEEEEIE